jgi:hypothetical protein
MRVDDPLQIETALKQGLDATNDRPVLIEVMVAKCPYPKI